ncbi:MAG TPA: hypothetical protein VFK69_08355 [Candidatus Eisenbacteria bacterium]|nr:hypothetical protein [Candidatus Eisenbacteria bacterium]
MTHGDALRPLEAFTDDLDGLAVEVSGPPTSPAPGVLVWRCPGDRVLVEAGPSCTVREIDVDGACALLLVPGRMLFGPPRPRDARGSAPPA